MITRFGDQLKNQQQTNLRSVCVTARQVTIGLDIGDRWTHFCILDTEGSAIAEGRFRSTPDALKEQFEGIPRCRIALEVGTHSRWMSRILEELAHEVIVANARKVRLIKESDNKTDKMDARTLARLARVDPSLLSPICHRSQKIYPDLAKLRARDLLVRSRTKLINAVRGIVKATGARLPDCSTGAFAKKIMDDVPNELRESLEPLIDTIRHLSQQITTYDKQLEGIAKYEYPETAKLRQVPGVGTITALQFVLTIEDPTRFAKSRQVGSFLGLQPRQSQSGDRAPQLGISKAGDSDLRRTLVQCAHYMLGCFGKDCDLRRWGLSLMQRGGKNAKKRAIVAVARKLAVLLHRLWTSDAPYEPFRKQIAAA